MIFLTVLLVEISNVILCENNMTTDVILHDDVSKNFICSKMSKNIPHKLLGLDVNHSIHACECSFSYFTFLYVTK